MELHKNTTEAFINYLKRHGYPEKSIVLEWGDGQYAFDIAIVAEDYITPIAIYEIKGKKSPQSIRMGIEHLRKVKKVLNIVVPCGLVFGDDKTPYFEVLDVSDIIYNDENIDIADFMNQHVVGKPISYKNMQSGILSKSVMQKQERKREQFDKLKPLCWGLFPLIAVALLLLDAFNIYTLTNLRLIVIGSVVVIVLLPFFNEITLKDVSFKRKGKNNE